MKINKDIINTEKVRLLNDRACGDPEFFILLALYEWSGSSAWDINVSSVTNYHDSSCVRVSAKKNYYSSLISDGDQRVSAVRGVVLRKDLYEFVVFECGMSSYSAKSTFDSALTALRKL